MRFRGPHRSAIPISLYWQRGRFSLWKTKIFQSASRGTTRDCHADFRSSRYVFRQFNYAIVHMRGRTCGIRSVLSHRLPALVEKSLTPTVHFQRSLRFCATRTRPFRTSLPATWNFFARIARSRHELCPPPQFPPLLRLFHRARHLRLRLCRSRRSHRRVADGVQSQRDAERGHSRRRILAVCLQHFRFFLHERQGRLRARCGVLAFFATLSPP